MDEPPVRDEKKLSRPKYTTMKKHMRRESMLDKWKGRG